MKHKITPLLAAFIVSAIGIFADTPPQIVVARGQLRAPFTSQLELNRRANDIVKLYGSAGITVADIPDNTLSAKTADMDIAGYALSLKTELNRIREQIMNIE